MGEDQDDPIKMHVLTSYAYWQTDLEQEKLSGFPKEWNVMLDSGAFTNFTHGQEVVTVDGYIDYCYKHEGRFWRIINFDRIGDHELSRKNLLKLDDAGIRALPVFQRGDTLSSLVEMSQFNYPVCIGGISQNTAAEAEVAYLSNTMKAVRSLGIKAHLLGVGGDQMIQYRAWSADNSSWLLPMRYGRLRLWMQGKVHNIRRGDLEKRPTANALRALRAYGISLDEAIDRQNWKPGGTVAIAGVRSWIKRARAIANLGSRYVFATTPPTYPTLRSAWELEKENW